MRKKICFHLVVGAHTTGKAVYETSVDKLAFQ